METLAIFRNPNLKVKNPFLSLYFVMTFCLSSMYFGYTLVYLSAVNFSVIAKLYSIDFDISLAQGLFQGVLPIGGAIGATLSTKFITMLSRR